VGRIRNPKKQYHIRLGSVFTKFAYYKEHIFPLSTIEFEGHVFPAPGNVEAYLTTFYGDWRKLPSEASIRRSIHSPVFIKEIFGE
jgi:phosphorylcholine metabolism protein LicD